MSSVDDLEELIATRRLHGLDDNLYKEKSTDEMFEELNYIEHFKNKDNEVFRTDRSHCLGRTIIFQFNDRRLCLPAVVTMQELQAINKKVEELGWI